MANFAFSTGKLTVALATDPYTSGVVVGAVQAADFTFTMQVKEVREAASINLYPVADVQFDAEAMLKIDFTDLAEKLIEWTTGAAKTSSGGANIYTHTGAPSSKPKYVKLKLEGVLSDGRAATLEILRCKGIGMPLSMKRDDYTTPSVEFKVYPADNVTAAWTLTIAQS